MENYKQEIEDFIETVKVKYNINSEDYKDYILLLILSGFFGEENGYKAYITLVQYDNLSNKVYKEICEYIRTLDFEKIKKNKIIS